MDILLSRMNQINPSYKKEDSKVMSHILKLTLVYSTWNWIRKSILLISMHMDYCVVVKKPHNLECFKKEIEKHFTIKG